MLNLNIAVIGEVNMKIQLRLESGYLWVEMRDAYCLTEAQTEELYDAVHYGVEAVYDFERKVLTLV